jgi:hypothetical protein
LAVNLKGVERSLARMLHLQGDLAAGRYLFAPIYASFTESFDTADLKDAQALLEPFNG